VPGAFFYRRKSVREAGEDFRRRTKQAMSRAFGVMFIA